MAVFGKLRDHPYFLEISYQFSERVFKWFDPLIQIIGYQRTDRLVYLPEKIGKRLIFDCEMCGQCTLHHTGMTCPMTCPKDLRNGPCGGVRTDETCEVDPGLKCVWVEAYQRSTKMEVFGDDIKKIQPPLNQCLVGKSAFINVLCCEDDKLPPAWKPQTEMGALQ
jgi:hypothetical protein